PHSNAFGAANYRTSSRSETGHMSCDRILRAQDVLLHLAHRITWQVRHKMHALGNLEARDFTLQARNDVTLGERMPWLSHDNRHDRFAEVGIRHPNDRRLHDAWQRVDPFLDLLRIHVQATRDDQVLGASHDLDVPV